MAFTEQQVIDQMVVLVKEGDELVEDCTSGADLHYIENTASGMRLTMSPIIFRKVLAIVRPLANCTQIGTRHTWSIPRE